VLGVARAAAESCGVLARCEQSPDVAVLVSTLDAAAWKAQELEENGGLPDVSYHEAFRRARAADAFRLAASVTGVESATNAAYEAVHAFGSDAQAEQRVIALLRT
jgi:hypothetical protein